MRECNNQNVISSYTRNYLFDSLKIFACFMVIINHTNSEIFLNYFPSLSGKISLLLFFLSKIAVPIFFMISGALLLHKQDSYQQAYRKRLVRILIVILIFSMVTVILRKDMTFSFTWAFFQSLIQNPIIVPYWYLYSYLAILLLLPFLQKFVQALTKQDFWILFIILFLFQQIIPFLSLLNIIPMISNYFTHNFFSGELFYLFLGYYIWHVLRNENFTIQQKQCIQFLCVLLAVFGIIFCYFYTSYQFYKTGNIQLTLDNIYSLPIVCYCVGVFTFMTLTFKNKSISTFHHPFITRISNATFGVYLIHMIVIENGKELLHYLQANMNDLIAVILFDILVFFVSVVIITLLRNIKIITKFL